MADIKQAAKWMQEGKQVKRRSWPNMAVESQPDGVIRDADTDDSHISDVLEVADILADDWEIAE